MSGMIKQCASTVDLIYKMNIADLEQAIEDLYTNIASLNPINWNDSVTGAKYRKRECKKEEKVGKYLIHKTKCRLAVLYKELKET